MDLTTDVPPNLTLVISTQYISEFHLYRTIFREFQFRPYETAFRDDGDGAGLNR